MPARPGQGGAGNPRQVGVQLGRRAREGGAQRARQRREPPGQPGGQQVRAVGKAVGPAGGEQFVGAGEQGLSRCRGLAGSWSIPAMTADDSPAQDRSTRRRRGAASRGSRRIRAERAGSIASGSAPPAASLRRPRPPRLSRPRQQAGDQPERDGVAGFAGAQQVPQRRPGRPGALGGPVQHGPGEGVAGQRPQVRDPGADRRVGRPGRGRWSRR